MGALHGFVSRVATLHWQRIYATSRRKSDHLTLRGYLMSHELQKRHHYPILEMDSICQPEVYESDEERTQHAEAAEAMRYILSFLGEAQSAKGIACRALVMMHLLGIEDAHRHSKDFSSIARACGVSRELARQVAAKLEAFAGLRSQISRTDEGRRNMSKARRKVLNEK